MGTMTRDMERLTSEIRRGRLDRQQQTAALGDQEIERRRRAAAEQERRVLEVESLRAEVRQHLTDSRAKLDREASQLRSRLDAFTTGLRSEVEQLRVDMQQDLAGARAAWRGRASGGGGAAPSPAASAPATAASAGQRVDDLTEIPGIGPGMQERLHGAGIVSFAQLASASIQEVRGVLGELNRLANVDDWIREAKSRLGGA
ncbi:MAG: helix-hairpin-helix domain-containing protein [Acidobacteriota bacterium]